MIRFVGATFILCLFAFMHCAKDHRTWIDANVRINQIQILGSHNSYKQAIDPSLMKILSVADSATARSLDYAHIPLAEQLDLGLRNLELDIFHDPEGGRYAVPYGVRAVAEQGLPPGPPFDPGGRMQQPGFKVLHVQDIDFRSHCLTLNQALTNIIQWSKQHPDHLPVTILFNAKDNVINRPHFTRPLPFTRTVFDELDRAILHVIPRDHLITPDDVRGDFDTLEEAILTRGWPTLGGGRGKIMLLLNGNQAKRNAYTEGHPSLKGRLMFVDVPEGVPEAAFLVINNPIKEGELIRKLVQAGYMVRTRADSGTREARSNDTRRFQAALQSGAQVISTDYYQPDPAFGTGFQVRLPEGFIARFNAISLKEMGNPYIRKYTFTKQDH